MITRKNSIIALVIGAVMILLDQISKYLVIERLKPIVDYPLWDGVFHLHYAQNTGAAFSMFSGSRWIFVGLTGVVIIALVLITVFKKVPNHMMCYVPLGLIIGGAIGNFIDRIAVGYVVDFLYFKLINFAIFNIADSALVVGSILLCIYLLFIYKEAPALKQTAIEEKDLS